MTWQDLILTLVSLTFIAALIPSVVQRKTAPLPSCLLTGGGLVVIGVVDFTLKPIIIFNAVTTLVTAVVWFCCAAIAWRQREAS